MQLRMFHTYSKSLRVLHDAVSTCTKCPYHQINEGRVHGLGTKDSMILVVGQGPGPKEMETGRPFSGDSGRALRSYINGAGIDMADTYLTNLIRCSPPPEKGILAKAIRMCGGWLEDEVGLVNPRLIISLGALATTELTGLEGMEENTGRIVESKYGIPTIPMFHTAYLLRMRNDDPYRYGVLDSQMKEEWEEVRRIMGEMRRKSDGS